MKTLLCGIAKLENDYVREWVEYHLNLGFDHIIIGDNNDPDGEILQHPIIDYILSGKVTVIDVRTPEVTQMSFYNDLYDNYCNDYDWVMFLDIDEFLFLEEDKTVHEYLSRDVFKDFNSIKIHWIIMDDNNMLTNTGEPVVKRFSHPAKPIQMIWMNPNKPEETYSLEMNMFVKSFVKPKIENVWWDNAPQLIPKYLNKGCGLKMCNNKGDKLDDKYLDDTVVKEIDYTLAHIKHYRTKTIEEYISKKCTRAWPIVDCNDKDFVERYLNLNFFFDINEKTIDKIYLANDLKEKYNLNI